MKSAYFDIETTNIPDLVGNIEKIFCIAVKVDDEEPKIFTYLYHKDSNGNLKGALDLINSCDVAIGHNIVKFDIPVIEKFIGKITVPIEDTLITAKLLWSKDELLAIDTSLDLPPSLKGSYSLGAFGHRLKEYKGDYHDFTKMTDEMLVYCKQDVEVTAKLWNKMILQKRFPPENVRKCEYQVARCIFDQQEYGFYFDIDKAMNLATKLRFRKMNIEQKLKKLFPPIFVPDGDVVTPAKSKNQKIYHKITLPKYFNIMPFRFNEMIIDKQGRFKKPKKSIRFKEYPHKIINQLVEGTYQKIKLQKFNPSSRQQVVERLIQDYQWKPTNYTEKGSIKLEFE